MPKNYNKVVCIIPPIPHKKTIEQAAILLNRYVSDLSEKDFIGELQMNDDQIKQFSESKVNTESWLVFELRDDM